jgi:general secretion pathway protein H
MDVRYRESGFTLLEIVVVMVVVATLATLAALSIGNLGRSEALEQTAQRIILAVDLGAEEAALSGHPVGLDIYEGGYEYLIYRDSEWQVLNRGKLFNPYEFDAGIDVTLDTSNEASALTSGSDQDSTQPTVVLLPDGERWLRTIALFDSETNNAVTLLPSAGTYQIETASP